LNRITDHPLLVFVVVFLVLWLSAWIGRSARRRPGKPDSQSREDFAVVLPATLTLLGLIIGFAFSMAGGHFDQRRSYEEAEANAIGTEYLRADLLPAAEASRVRAHLRSYLQQRILFYSVRDGQELAQISAETSRLQAELWSTLQVPVTSVPTSITALAVSGMNEVLNAAGFAQSAWRTRIPNAAWILMALIAILCNTMIAYGALQRESLSIPPLVLPLVVSIAFLFIADIDSPRGGVIRVVPQNLLGLAATLR
jgi:uncharacterized membrane protein